MIDTFWYIVMVPMVYVSAVWCLIWTLIRAYRVICSPGNAHTARIFQDDAYPDKPPPSVWAAVWDSIAIPSVRQERPVFWAFLLVFHAALALLIVSHLDLLPYIHIIPPESPHMIGNGAVGAVFVICLLFLLFRRFVPPVSEISIFSDYILLFLLICVAVSGCMMSWGNSWSEDGFVITKQDLGLYLDSLIRFTFASPRDFLSGAHYSIVGVHVLTANLFLLYVPFSNVLHACFAVPMCKIRRG